MERTAADKAPIGKQASLASRNTTIQPSHHVKKISHTPRAKGISRSVNYLSSTSASRAKQAAGAHIHKPTTISSVNRIVNSALVSSETSINSKQMSSAVDKEKDLIDDGAASTSTKVAKNGRHKSQATLKLKMSTISTTRKSGQYSSKGPLKEPLSTENDNATAINAEEVVDSPHPKSQSRPSISGHSHKAVVHVTMNKTSELRAALHKRTNKSEAKSGSGTKTNNSKLRRRRKTKPAAIPAVVPV